MWKEWDVCRILGDKHTTQPRRTEHVEFQNAFAFPLLHESPSSVSFKENLLKVAWAIVLGQYAGTDQVTSLFQVYSDNPSIFRCNLESTQAVTSIIQSMQSADITERDFDQLSNQFDAALSIVQPHTKASRTTPHSALGDILHAVTDLATGKITVEFPPAHWTRPRALSIGHSLSKAIIELSLRYDKSLHEIDILSALDADILQAWNRKDLGNLNTPIHEIIFGQAMQRPDAFAVNAWDGNLTYADLDKLATTLARQLRRVGVERDTIIPVLFHKSKWTVVAMLAVLKAGGASCALNPDFPMERLNHIIRATRATIILTGRDLSATIVHPNIQSLIVDDELFTHAKNYSEVTDAVVKPHDLAFVMFTSGSTGTPKGIMIEHRGYAANAISQMRACSVNSMSRVLQFSSHSFDAILVEIFTPLMSGACICIPSEHQRMNDLAGVVNHFNVDWIGLTPTLTKVLRPADVPKLKTMCIWGETATNDVIDTWADAVELLNVYGPSECSVEVTTNRCSAHSRSPSNIGRPLQAVNIWLAQPDNPQRLVPIGAIGEIIVQGPTVARGYLDDPVHTKDAFLVSPHWLPDMFKTVYPRCYRTGDLARYNDDGTLQILGRRDTQVKIRGHRIELGEIEHHLNSINTVGLASAVEVVSPGSKSIQKLLVAFQWPRYTWRKADDTATLLMCSSEKHREEASQTEIELEARLPSHMVPSLYLPLSYMPVSASGKADRKMLRALAESLSDEQLSTYLAHIPNSVEKRLASTDTERGLIELCASLLRVPSTSISADDSFFWLGGDSISAMRLSGAARRRGMNINVADVLRNPRISDLALLAQEAIAEPDSMLLSPEYSPFSSIRDQDVETTVTAACAKLSLRRDEIDDVGVATDYQIENLAWTSLTIRAGTNYITFDFDTSVDPYRLQKSCVDLVAHYPILRTVYVIRDRRVFQIVLREIQHSFIHHINSRNADADTQQIMKDDTGTPLDISKALIKFWVLQSGGRVRRLILRASHLQYDGVTLIRWCKELGLLYSSASPTHPASFINYTHFAATRNATAAATFWRGLLSGSSMTNVFAHSHIPHQNVLDGQVETLIPTEKIRSHPSITIGTTIKAAWALILAEMAGTDDVVFGSVTWGRNAPHPDAESVAGACIDNIPVRVRLSPSSSASPPSNFDLLKQVQDQYFEAVSYESFRYKRIVSECTDWRPWERLSTLVEYENLAEETASFPFGEGRVKVDEIRPPGDRHDVTIYSMPVKEQTFIALDFCKRVMGEAMAQKMLDRLCMQIGRFNEDVMAPLKTEPAEKSGLPRIPMQLPKDKSSKGNESNDNSISPILGTAGEVVNSLKSREAEAFRFGELRHVVESAWMAVLCCKLEDLEDFVRKQTPFYDIWGNLIAALAFADWYNENGYNLSMENVLENPTMSEQIMLLSRLGVLGKEERAHCK